MQRVKNLRTTFNCVQVTQDVDSALILAARHGLTDVVVELVNAGANFNLQNNVWKMASTMVLSIVDMVLCHTGWRLSTDTSSQAWSH